VVHAQRGNAAYQAKQYREAHEAYSEALALNVEEPALNAVLLCNRAAALHACGQHLEAIADCCVAAQLDDKYPRVLQVGRKAQVRSGLLVGSAASNGGRRTPPSYVIAAT
jgi:DnaJ family protein C protein 7